MVVPGRYCGRVEGVLKTGFKGPGELEPHPGQVIVSRYQAKCSALTTLTVPLSPLAMGEIEDRRSRYLISGHSVNSMKAQAIWATCSSTIITVSVIIKDNS